MLRNTFATALVLGLIIANLSSCNSGRDQAQAPATPQQTAYTESQKAVAYMLKAQIPPEFPDFKTIAVDVPAENIYKITAYVDAVNPSGVKQRLMYLCKMKYDPDKTGRQWTVVSLDFSK